MIDLASIVSTAALVLTGVLTFYTARWRNSGRVDSSEATELWTESRSVRAELRAEITLLKVENATCRAETATLRARIFELEQERAKK